MILNRLKAAALVEKTAEQQHDLVLSRSSGDKEVTGLANNDYMDLMRVAALIKRGAFNEAYEKLNSLDTAVRDEVPQEVYRFLDRKTRSGDYPLGIGRNTYNEGKMLREGIEGKSFCVTGTFAKQRKDVWREIEDAGGHVHETIRSDTNYLVTGADIGRNKVAKAEKFGVKVIDEKELLHMIRGGRRIEKDLSTWKGGPGRRGKFFDENRSITLSEFKKLLREGSSAEEARQTIRSSKFINFSRKPLTTEEIKTIVFGQLPQKEQKAICAVVEDSDINELGGKRPFLSRLQDDSLIDDAVFVAKYRGEYYLCNTEGYDYVKYVVRLGGFDESACMSDEDYMVDRMA
jgi:hypothetical protein